MKRPAISPRMHGRGRSEFLHWGRMKNLKIWQKLALLAAIFTIPFLVVTWTLLSTVDSQGVAFARQERDGLQAVLPLLRIGQDLQKHRNLVDQLLEYLLRRGAVTEPPSCRPTCASWTRSSCTT